MNFKKVGMLAVVATSLVCTVTMMWYIVDMVRSVESPRHLKVADCNSDDVTFTTTLPPGHSYDLLFAVPSTVHLSPSLRTHITISDPANTVTDFWVASGDAHDCNWLHNRHDLQGYILSWTNKLRDKLHGKQTYKFTIHFSEAPPQDASLWLHWLQNRKDF